MPLLADDTYARYSKIILSTSTLSSPALDGGGFGPVNDDCYGIGYGITDRGSRFVVSTYKNDGAQMTQALAHSLEEMNRVLKTTPAPKPK